MEQYDGNGNFLLAMGVNVAASLVLLGGYRFFFDDGRSLLVRVVIAWSLLPIALIITESGVVDLASYFSYTALIVFLVVFTSFILGHKISLLQEELKYHKTYVRETNQEKDFEEFQTFAKRVGVDNTRWYGNQ